MLWSQAYCVNSNEEDNLHRVQKGVGETVDNTGINTSKRALGQYLYEARLKAGYTQLSAADRVSEWLGNSFGPTTLSKIESGTRTLSFSEARALARTYGLSLDQIAEFDLSLIHI